MEKKAQVVVLGAGPAGYVCAIRLAQLGQQVTVIEKDEVGGVCLNRGCIPSKALISAGHFYQSLSHASEMGFQIQGVQCDFSKLMKWKESVVQKLTQGVSSLLQAHGCQVIRGKAQFMTPHALKIQTVSETLILHFEKAVIATGSRPVVIPGFEVDQTSVIDSTGALNLKKIPQSLLCLGGGYIGLELGTFYAQIGSRVTIVEPLTQLLSGVDPALVQVVSKRLKALQVQVRLQTQAVSCQKTSKGVQVKLQQGSQEIQETFETVLVTVGRQPNSDDLALEKAGLKTDNKGFLKVDDQCKTAVPHLYAIGDIAGQPLLAHKGSKEGIVAAEVIAGKKTAYDVKAMPAVIFTDPEIATVGWTEQQARDQGRQVRVGVFPFAANGRALSLRSSEGFVKVIGDAQTGQLLGVHAVGPEVSNLISEAALGIEMGAQAEDLALTVHPHPTLSETFMEAAESFLGHAIHVYQRNVK